MNCADVKHRLEHQRSSEELAADTALRAHLKDCASCRDYAEELRLTRLLRAMPVPPASEGFADRALARAWETAQPQSAPSPAKFAWAGVAASALLAAVLFTQVFKPMSDNPSELDASPGFQVVYVEPQTVKPVTVRLVSKEAMPEATVTIRLDDKVRLAGYPEQDTLSWQTAIPAGSNDISLPVELLGSESGSIQIEIQSGQARKTMTLSVTPGNGSSSVGTGSPVSI